MSPEVILDRYIRSDMCHKRGCSGYVGKLDIDRVEPVSLRRLLRRVQSTMNEALGLEGPNASGGVQHDPLHFDYIDVTCGTENAHAFQHDGFAFITVTVPMVQSLWDLAGRLSRSTLVQQLLGLDTGTLQPESLRDLLFDIQLNFLVAHEYTHHVHRHNGVNDLWTAFFDDGEDGSLGLQAEELDADGYSLYLGVAYLLRGGGRPTALQQLGRTDVPGTSGDELLLTSFFLAVMAFFCSLWRGSIDMSRVYQFDHPPPPVRIKYAIQTAQMWAGQNESLPSSWFSGPRFRPLFRAAADVMGGTARQTWDAPMAFLRSSEGNRYDGQLFERFEAIRKKRDESASPADGDPA
ncbi:MAG TPA: hypothetical protein VEU96_02650 [Bryobacteraceae bacterium]|nr:hypothetical protein [Bryobacteraceae bacterium]